MFEGFDNSQYKDEVRELWGDTDAYRESSRRTTGYGEADWRQIQSESEEVVSAFVTLLQHGAPADGEPARALAERHRQHISRWFYPCSAQMHRGLAAMYISDERFKRNYEQQAQGLADFVHAAIVANAQRRGALTP